MNTFVIRVVLVAVAAGVIAAPAISVASAVGAERAGSVTTLTLEQSPIPIATPTRTEPVHTPLTTRTPEPTRKPEEPRPTEPLRTPDGKPNIVPQPKPEPNGEMWEILVRACLVSRAIDVEACERALNASGVSLADFRAKINARLEEIARLHNTGSAPENDEAYVWLKKCLLSRELLGPECYRAWQLSGLSSEEFDKKITAIWSQQKK